MKNVFKIIILLSTISLIGSSSITLCMKRNDREFNGEESKKHSKRSFTIEDLVSAIDDNNYEKVKEILDVKGNLVNKEFSKPSTGTCTPLLHAISPSAQEYKIKPSKKIIKLLINKGADIKRKNDKGENLLHLFFNFQKGVLNIADFSDIIESVINKGVSVKDKNNEGNTPFHLLIGYITDSEESNFDDTQLLNYVTSLIKIFIKQGIDINVRNNKGDTPFHLLMIDLWAGPCTSEKSVKNLIDFITFLINHGIDINARSNSDDTPFHLSMQNYLFGNEYPQGTIDVVTFLINHGMDVNARNKSNETNLDILFDSPGLDDDQKLGIVLDIFLQNGAMIDGGRTRKLDDKKTEEPWS